MAHQPQFAQFGKFDLALGTAFAIRTWMVVPNGDGRPWRRRSYRLRGMFGHWWDHATYRATCGLGKSHETPHESCECGVWAYWTAWRATNQDVSGVVEVSGPTLIGDYGCRTQNAKIVALAANSSLIFTNRAIQQELEHRYKVPIYAYPHDMVADWPLTTDYLREPRPPRPPRPPSRTMANDWKAVAKAWQGPSSPFWRSWD